MTNDSRPMTQGPRLDILSILHERGFVQDVTDEPELRARLLVANRILALQNELIHAREELRAAYQKMLAARRA